MSSRIATVIKAVTDLPARLFGGNAQKVEVSGLDYTLHLDLEKLPPAEAGEAPGKWTVVWDEPSNTYRRVEFTDLPPPLGSMGLAAEEVDDRVAQLLQAGANVAIVYDDAGNRLTIHSIAPGGSTGPQNLFDTIHDARLATVPAAVKTITLSGYDAPGDAGPSMPCRRTAAMVTVHAGVFRTTDRYTDAGVEDFANGGWWEYIGTNQSIYIEWFGGKADYTLPVEGGIDVVNPTPTDNWQAIKDAYSFMYTDVHGLTLGKPNFAAGPAVQLGYRSYYCSQPIRPDRGIVLKGMGHGYYHNSANTRLIFPAGVRGLQFDMANQIGDVGVYSSDSIVRDIFIKSLGWGGQTNSHGITMNIAVAVEGCSVEGFGGNAISIAADVGAVTNANGFYISHCVLDSNAGHGVYCAGGDANAGVGMALNLLSNGGWGIRDDSFLGNFWEGCHEAYNQQGPYYLVGLGNRAVVIGCYNEGYTTPSYCGPYAHIIGGTHASGISVSSDGGNVWYLNNVYPFYLATQEPGDVINVRMRGKDYPNMIVNVDTPSGTFNWTYDAGNKAMQLGGQYVTLNGSTLTAGRAEGLSGGKPMFPRGIWIGGDQPSSLSGVRFFGNNRFDTNAPYGGIYPDTYAVGDTLLNALFTGGAFWAVVCTQAGAIAHGNWVAGQNYANWGDDRSTLIKNGTHFYRLVGETLGSETLSVDAPVHTSGNVTGATDGHTWRYLTSTAPVFKKIGRLDDIDASVVYDPPSLAAGAVGALQNLTVTGAALGDFIAFSFDQDLQGARLEGYVHYPDNCSFRFVNPTAGTIDLPSGTVRARVIKFV